MNLFALDANCISVYEFESSIALGGDDIGNNNLTNSGLTQDTTNFKVGTASGLITSGEYLYKNDVNLSADFPCKSGTTNLTYSVGGWVRPTWIPGAGCDLFAKAKSFILIQVGTSLQLWHYYNDTHTDGAVSLADAFVDDQWSHVTVTYDDATKAWNLYAYVGSELKTASGTFDHNGYASAESFTVGQNIFYSQYFTGNLDEVFVFGRVLSQAEIVKIINGTFPGTTGRRRCVIA